MLLPCFFRFCVLLGFSFGFNQVDAQRGWKELGAQIDVSSTPGGGALRCLCLCVCASLCVCVYVCVRESARAGVC